MNTVVLGNTPPFGIPQRTVRAQFNNDYASAVASGDPRLNAKQYDKPGVSRGRGTWNQAGIDAAGRMADGIAAAYSNNFSNNQFNADAALRGQLAQEQQALALGSLNQQNAYANQLAALQRQGQVLGLFDGLLGGLLR